MQELAEHEYKTVAGQPFALLVVARAGTVDGAHSRVLGQADLVGRRGEVGQGEHQRSQGHDEHAPAQPARLVAGAAEVADEGQAHAGGDVIGAGDEARLVAAQVEAPLDGGDHRVDEAVDDHALEEGGGAQEEQHPTRGVEELDGFGSQGPPATQLSRVIGGDFGAQGGFQTDDTVHSMDLPWECACASENLGPNEAIVPSETAGAPGA